MNFIRSHIKTFTRLLTAAFAFSWLLMAIILPVNISGISDSHDVYSVFNADEGCFELVVDHHKNADDSHLMDENNDAHSFHNSCCFDDIAITYKKQETDYDLPLAYVKWEANADHFSEKYVRSESLQEKPLPPPLSDKELRITRLLI